jgi:hypothetical protein
MKEKKTLRLIFAFMMMGMLLFSPFLLVIDYKRYGPFVVLFWFMTIAYFLFLKKRVDRRFGLIGSSDEDGRNLEDIQSGKQDEKNNSDEKEVQPIQKKDQDAS